MKFDDTRFKTPIYTVAEGGRHLGVPESTFRAWATGYVRQDLAGRQRGGDPFITTVPGERGRPTIPFVGLVEGTVAAAFRRAGVSLQHLKHALAVLEQQIGIKYALASRFLYTDGAHSLRLCRADGR